MAFTREQQLAARNYGMTPEEYMTQKPWLGVGGESTAMGGGGSISNGTGAGFNVSQPGLDINPSANPNGSSTPSPMAPNPNAGGGGSYAGGDWSAPPIDTSWFEKIFNRAGDLGSDNQFNNSANRLRERLDSSAQGMKTKATGFNIGRGFGASGAQDRSMMGIDSNTQNAYATGLNELANMQKQWEATGLQTMLGAATGRSNADQFTSQQGFQGQQNALDRILKDLLSARDGKTSMDLAKLNSNSNAMSDFLRNLLSGLG